MMALAACCAGKTIVYDIVRLMIVEQQVIFDGEQKIDSGLEKIKLEE